MSPLERLAKVPTIDQLLSARLLIRPRRREGEHTGGYWLRLASANGLRQPRWLSDPAATRAQAMVRVCPLCLGETDAFWREEWFDGQQAWCALHGIWLADRCEACGRTLRWSDVGFDRCSCGSDLRELGARPVPHSVEASIGQAPVSVLLWLGALSKHGLTGKPLKRASRRTLVEAIDLIELGADLVGDWPGSFFRMLDAHRLSIDAGGDRSLMLVNDALPGLRRRIGKLRDRTWRLTVDEALGRYVAASLETSAPLVGRNLPESRPPSVMKMARELRVRPERLAAVLDRLPELGVTRRRTASGRCRRVASPAAVTAAKLMLDSQITAKRAARMLNLTPARVRQLVADGRLLTQDGKLDRAAVMELRSSLTSRAGTGRVPSDAVTFEQALRYWIPVDRTGALIDAIHSGELTVYGIRSADRSEALMLSPSQLSSWAAKQPVTDRGWLTIPEVAEHLALKQQVVYHLVQVGLISTETMRAARRATRVVPKAALVDFESRFEPLVRAAARAGIHRRRGLEWAEATGALLASGPQVDGGRQYFVRRVPSGLEPVHAEWRTENRQA